MTRFVSIKRRSVLVAAAVCPAASLLATVPASAAQRASAPIVRDHGPKPIIRDHRTSDSTAQVVKSSHWTTRGAWKPSR